MSDNKDAEETIPHGNEWEVVSLTASTYAAAPGPEQIEVTEEKDSLHGEDEAETSHAMFISRHFVFPPSQHENLPLELGSVELHKKQEVENALLETTAEGSISNAKTEEHWKIEGFNVSDDFPRIQLFDEKGDKLSMRDAEFEEGMSFQDLKSTDKEQSVYGAASFKSLHSEVAMTAKSTTFEENRSISGQNEQSDQGLDLDISDLPKDKIDDSYSEPDLPCKAWWKRRASSLYAYAKEANTFWSLFVAATVMGLVILGHRWQQERWKVLQLKWENGINDMRMGRMMGTMSRFKDVFVGGHRRGSCIEGSALMNH